MEQIQLDLQVRKESGSGEAKKLRAAGLIPCVVYGGKDQPVKGKLLQKDFDRIMRRHAGESLLLHVKMTDNGKLVEDFVSLLKDVQLDPVSDKTVHLDFQRISMGEKITIFVPILLKGAAAGLKKPGATLEHIMREVEVFCLPKDVPGHIEVDVTALDVHDSVHVRDLALPGGVEVNEEADSVVATVVFGAQEEEAPAAEGAEGTKAEPEVIKENPKDEKAAEGGAAKPAAGGEPKK